MQGGPKTFLAVVYELYFLSFFFYNNFILFFYIKAPYLHLTLLIDLFMDIYFRILLLKSFHINHKVYK